ncbi:hypothetical protein ACFWUP_09385 [Nocardia sp. NPDC058658]|uniref:hypothetical protein n=1 Tax=Nocardia sp. NPDC058658 TaxID=3346580 RepID=UPI0036562F35
MAYVFALQLSSELRMTVFFDEEGELSSIMYGATSRGLLIPSLIDGDDESGYWIERVGAPIPDFPNASVGEISDSGNRKWLTTPITDRIASEYQPEVTPAVIDHLGHWELLIARMAENWPPSGVYLVDAFCADLTRRDHLDVLLGQLTEAGKECRIGLVAAVSNIDDQFKNLTVDDNGSELARVGSFDGELSAQSWWWRRRPANIPWR